MGRHVDGHRALKEILVMDDQDNVTQRYEIDSAGRLITPPGMAGASAFAVSAPRADRFRGEVHAPPVPMIHGVYPPIRTLQTPDESDPFYGPTFSSATVFSSRADFESDFRPWTGHK
jgi:hypothetical protein